MNVNLSTSSKALPSNEQIMAKKGALNAYAQKVLSGEIRLHKKETIAEKLRLIADEIRLMKEVPYSKLKIVLKEQIGLSVGEDTLRQFCQAELGFEKRAHAHQRKKSSATI